MSVRAADCQMGIRETRFGAACPTRRVDDYALTQMRPATCVPITTERSPTRPGPGLSSPQAFAAWLTRVAMRYPQVKQFSVMNEPNQPAFLRPQFARDRVNISAATAGSSNDSCART